MAMYETAFKDGISGDSPPERLAVLVVSCDEVIDALHELSGAGVGSGVPADRAIVAQELGTLDAVRN